MTYLHGKLRNTYIYLMQERQYVSNTSRHQKVVINDGKSIDTYRYFLELISIDTFLW